MWFATICWVCLAVSAAEMPPLSVMVKRVNDHQAAGFFPLSAGPSPAFRSTVGGSASSLQVVFRPLADSLWSDFPLAFCFEDDGFEGDVGTGWQLALLVDERCLSLSSVLPAVVRGEAGAFLPLPEGRLSLRSKTDGFFLDSSAGSLRLQNEGSGARARVWLSGSGSRFEFAYDGSGLLVTVVSGPRRLLFDRDVGGVLRVMRLLDGDAEVLRLDLELFEREALFWLRTLVLSRGSNQRSLRMDYGFEPELSASEAGEPWLPVSGDPHFLLPEGMSLKSHRGLRFMDLNKDGLFDLVRTRSGSLDSWLWDPRAEVWQSFSHVFSLPVPLEEGRVPTGAQLINIPRIFEDQRFSTTGFQSVMLGRFQPKEDGRSFSYEFGFFFPRTFLDQLKPDPELGLWRFENHPNLVPPIVFGYKGRPAPFAGPGTRAVEGLDNQAVQVRPIRRRTHLFYAGLRFRDAETGSLLAGPHRDVGHCRPRYQTTWTRDGVTRKVAVDLCQAVWRAESDSWFPANFEDRAFWTLLTSDGRDGACEGEGMYNFPSLGQDQDFHLEAFRHVRFATLKRDRLFALIFEAGGCGVCPVEQRRRPIKAMFRLQGVCWRRLEDDDPFFPPDDFFRDDHAFFQDVDGDGLDDAVVPFLTRRIYLNERRGKPWSRFVAIPPDCNLADGSCRLQALDEDGRPDLFLLDGKKVYLNRLAGRGLVRLQGVVVD